MTMHAVRPPSGFVEADPPFMLITDYLTGPRTLVGPGEYCLLCEDGMEAGEVYLFVHDGTTRHGIAHESCVAEHVLLAGG